MVSKTESRLGGVTISIITVVFNGVKDIEETINSVLSQTYSNVEYILIDGGSTDGTLEVIHKYQNKISRWISERDQGIYDAMNKGVSLAQGDWVNFMNCGDRFASPDILETLAKLDLNNYDLIYGDAIMEYNSFSRLYPKYPLRQIWKEMPFCHQALFMKTVLLKENPFNLNYKLSADYDFIYKSVISNRKFLFVDKVICYFSYKEGASVGNPLKSILERKSIALSYEFKIYRWLYYLFYVAYRRIAVQIKELLGGRLAEKITYILKSQ